jgi:hypothetical protein
MNRYTLDQATTDLSLEFRDFIHNASPLGFLSFTLSSIILLVQLGKVGENLHEDAFVCGKDAHFHGSRQDSTTSDGQVRIVVVRHVSPSEPNVAPNHGDSIGTTCKKGERW